MSPELKQQIEHREHVIQKVVEMLISALHLDHSHAEIDPDVPLFGSGLGLDSVDAVEIMVSMESEFGVLLEEHEGILALRTVNSLVEAIINAEPHEYEH